MSIRSGDLLLLDTSVFVHLARRDRTGEYLLSQYKLEQRVERPLFCTASEGEALGLARYWKWGKQKREMLNGLFSELVRLDVGLPEIVLAYSELHGESLSNGLNLGENDMWIAASAKAAGAVVVTCDTDFLRVPATFVAIEHVPHQT